jgi:hypothetical protein
MDEATLIGTPPAECKHVKCLPEFDLDKAKDLPAHEVQRLYPRFDGECPDCHGLIIMYASYDHFICGDY